MSDERARTDGPWMAAVPPLDADEYGEAYGDWEDPYMHTVLTMCTGCDMCAPWEARTYEQIRDERRAEVARRRAREREAAGS